MIERLDPPLRLGDMTLVARLGEGGMATVYLGAIGQGSLVRPAAIKLLRADVPDHDYRTRFLDEAKLVVRLHHNNLVDVRAAGELDGQLYIAMEAIAGRDLADIWDRCARARQRLPVELAVHVAREVLRGLHYAHTLVGLSLVHRDVSPSNILIDWSGAVRLADFGLATSSLKAARTMPGIVFGKVGYMAPEQATRSELDGRADVYATGVVLWELLTGRALRPAETTDTDVVARFEAPPPSVYEGRVDPELDEIVLRALARDPDQRYASARAMLDALGRWLAKHAPETSQEQVAEFMARLFGEVAETERAERERMIAVVSGEYPPASTPATEPLRRSAAEGVDYGEPDEYIEAGTIIAERYRVLTRLGRGGMGTVYLGEHLTVGRRVAIKVLTHVWSKHPSVARRFRAEARAASAAGHPNIVEVFDAGELPDGRLYLVMEVLTGRNLFEEIQACGPLPVARACRIVRDIARAVKAAHDVGIIHRDLKPDNVMLVDRDGEGEFVKVLDFGVSASLDDTSEARMTLPGQAIGTPEYMAPEQCRGRPPTPLFDVYAIGAMFYELLAGDPPFLADSFVEVMAVKTTTAAPPIAQRRPDVPERLGRLIDDCLALDPANRPASMHVLLAHLDEVLRALPRDSGGRLKDPEAGGLTTQADAAAGTGVERARSISGPAATQPRRVRVLAIAAAVLLVVVAGTAIAAVIAPRTGGDPSAGDAAEGAAMHGATDPGARDDGADPNRSGRADGASTGRERDEAGSDGASRETLGSAQGGDGVTPGGSEGTDDASSQKAGGETEGASTDPGGTSESAAGGGHKSSGSPHAPKPWATEACAERRQTAANQRADGDFRALHKTLERKECWEDRAEWIYLEVKALSELERWSECVSAGGKSKVEKVRKIVEICRSRTG